MLHNIIDLSITTTAIIMNDNAQTTPSNIHFQILFELISLIRLLLICILIIWIYTHGAIQLMTKGKRVKFRTWSMDVLMRTDIRGTALGAAELCMRAFVKTVCLKRNQFDDFEQNYKRSFYLCKKCMGISFFQIISMHL